MLFLVEISQIPAHIDTMNQTENIMEIEEIADLLGINAYII